MSKAVYSLHLHLIKMAHKCELIFIQVEMSGVEPESELGCLCAATVCSLTFDLDRTSGRKTKPYAVDLQEC